MTVYLVGAGPGDEGLITVKGLALLSKADAVVYDRLANPSLLSNVPDDAEMVSAGKGPGSVDLTQDQINETLYELSQRHECVVRLKGGDPFVFGRGGEEALYLQERGVRYEVVPGITSSIAAPAYAGIPVTHRAVATNFTVVTGHEDPAKQEEQVRWKELARIDGTLVILMGVGNRGAIADALISGGKNPETPVAIVRHGTHTYQHTVRCTLNELARVDAQSPSVIVIGEVAALDLSWFETKPLFGKKIVVTRAREQQSELSKRLSDLGAQVIEAPSITVVPTEFEVPSLDDVTYVVFTSINGVRLTMERLFATGRDLRYFGGVSLCAVGDSTAGVLREYGLTADIVPSRFVAEELLELLGDAPDGQQNKVVWFSARDARDVLDQGLRERGYEVHRVEVYSTQIAALEPTAVNEIAEADVITFASSNTVRYAIDLCGHDVITSIPVAVSIGPITSETMREKNITITREADPHTIEGIVAAVCDAVQK